MFVEDNDVESVLLTVDDPIDVVFDVVVFVITLVVEAFFVMEVDAVELVVPVVVVLGPNNLRGYYVPVIIKEGPTNYNL